MKYRAAGLSDVGLVRDINQDRFLVDESLGLFAVADGMGGHVGGEVAARSAIETLESEFRSDPTPSGLIKAVKAANSKIWGAALDDLALRGMGTTLTACMVLPAGEKMKVFGAHVGDSRAYLGRSGHIIQLTSDHTLVEELVKRGHLSREEAAKDRRRHTLTRALGIEPDVAIESFEVNVSEGDRVLLCSDGLSNELSDQEISRILFSNPAPEKAASALMQAARREGGRDNITVIVIAFGDPEKASSPGASAVSPKPIKISRPRWQRRPFLSRGFELAGEGPPLVSFRTLLFLLAAVILGCVVYGTVFWFANDTYYVGVENGKVAIFKGLPSGQLWFKPHLIETTSISVSSLLPSEADALSSGVVEPSFSKAEQLVKRIASFSTSYVIPQSTGG